MVAYRVEPLLVVLSQIWRKRKLTSAPASVGLPLKRHNLQTKRTSIVVMVAGAVVVVGTAAGVFLLLGKEQLAKPFPPSLWSIPPSSRSSVIATS